MDTEKPAAPIAPRRDHVIIGAGGERTDPWFWLRDRDDPAVREHLARENSYFQESQKHLADLREQIFQEIRGRVVEDESSLPVPRGPYEYYWRTEADRQYRIHCRRRGSGVDAGPEEILLDENQEAKGHDYFRLGALTVSLDQTLLLYSVDTDGSERYAIRLRDLATGSDLADVIEGASAGGAWAAMSDRRVFFYVRMDAAHRPYQIWRHVVGTRQDSDVMVFEEADERFGVGVRRSLDDAVILVESSSRTTAECRWVDATAADEPLRILVGRREGVDYTVEHHRGRRSFFVLTNENAVDFRLCEIREDESAWSEVLGERPGVRLEHLEVFSSHALLAERTEARTRVAAFDLDGGELRHVPTDEEVSTVDIGDNREFETRVVRYDYTSLTTPETTYGYDLETGERTLLHRRPVGGGFSPADYVTTREWAPAMDGTAVPISVVRRVDTPVDGSAPCLLYGYGSYEISVDPKFSYVQPSLLDRGWVFAIAHIRGGGEMGRRWYEDGKLFAKRNTFTDYLAAADHLIEQRYTCAGRIVARGGSAGGLLMGAVVNARPELFAGVVAQVPFVDVLSTMEDETLPLTVGEFEEWGNPKEAAAYDYIATYSPYDNVARQPYPRILATAGLNDPRVAYWEPAKWVQRLRERSTSGAEIFLRVDLGAGHGGMSGRYDAWREEAEILAFVIETGNTAAGRPVVTGAPA